MSQNPDARTYGHQPRLPLVEAESSTGTERSADEQAEWRLDEHTRLVGRMGIAAARARLRSPNRPSPGDGGDARGRAA